jgi:hypothetical protein
MKKTNISSLLCAVVLILILGAAPNAPAQGVWGGGGYHPPTPPLAMTINHGDACTTSQSVSLDTNMQWSTADNGKWKYRKGETPNLVNEHWITMYGPSGQHDFIDPAYGLKTVYMERLNIANNSISPTLSDSIDYKQACAATDATLRDLTLIIQNKRYPDRFKFDVMYQFYGARTDHDNIYKIEIKVIPQDASFGTASFAPPTTLNYTSSQGSKLFQGIEYRSFSGTLTVNAPAQGQLPKFGRLKFIAMVTGGPLRPARVRSISKLILLEKVPYTRTQQKTECTGAPGGKGDDTIGAEIPLGWLVGETVLTLNGSNQRKVSVGLEIRYDSNPLPAVGIRAVRWVELWHWDSRSQNYVCKIHWWCEGFSNKNEGGNKYAFRYTLTGNQIKIKVQ